MYPNNPLKKIHTKAFQLSFLCIPLHNNINNHTTNRYITSNKQTKKDKKEEDDDDSHLNITILLHEQTERKKKGGGDDLTVSEQGEDVGPFTQYNLRQQQHPGREHLHHDHAQSRFQLSKRFLETHLHQCTKIE